VPFEVDPQRAARPGEGRRERRQERVVDLCAVTPSQSASSSRRRPAPCWEEVVPAVDLSRTVGWFTTLFPVALAVESTAPGALLQSVKEQLRAIPDRGFGYGVLRSPSWTRPERPAVAAWRRARGARPSAAPRVARPQALLGVEMEDDELREELEHADRLDRSAASPLTPRAPV
jgi:hypothetical protein